MYGRLVDTRREKVKASPENIVTRNGKISDSCDYYPRNENLGKSF